MNKINKQGYADFYLEDFIFEFQKTATELGIFEKQCDAEKHFFETNNIKDYTLDSKLAEYLLHNTLLKANPIKLTKEQKIKLLLLLKESNCEADIYMSYEDILALRDNSSSDTKN